MRASTTAGAESRFPLWLITALLVLVTIGLYCPVIGYDFINFDDPEYVSANPHVQGGLTWENIGWALTTLHFGLWHPLTWVSHMLDCQCFGLRPGWHHLTSVLLHAANTGLLFVVLRRMTGARWRSAMVAALFALHPLHVESVAWVAERKDVLSTFFDLLTLLAYHRYTECRRQNAECGMPKPATPNPQQATRLTFHVSRFSPDASTFYILSLFFFALGLMSKPMIVTLPLLLLLLDYWPLRRFELAAVVARPSVAARLIVEKLPFVLAALLTGLITLYAANRVGSLPSAAECPISDRLANVMLSYARYFLQVFWPGHLAVYYPFPATFSVWSVAGAALLLVGISATAFWLAQRWPYVVVGWLWYLVSLLPVIGLLQLADYSHADRYTYVPLIGLFVGLVWGAGELVSHWRGLAPAWAAAAVAVVIVLCMALTQQQLGHWEDSEALFRHALQVTENNYIAHGGLGTALGKRGQIDGAISHFQEALRLKPDFTDVHYNLGNALSRKGQIEEAISHFQEAIRLKPDFALAHNNLGNARLRKGQIEEAISHFQEAIRLQPDYALAHNNLGNALYRKGRDDEAISQYEAAIRLSPDYADAHNDLGLALYRKGRTGEAISEFQEALRLDPDHAAARKNLDFVLAGKAGSSRQPGAAPNP